MHLGRNRSVGFWVHTCREFLSSGVKVGTENGTRRHFGLAMELAHSHRDLRTHGTTHTHTLQCGRGRNSSKCRKVLLPARWPESKGVARKGGGKIYSPTDSIPFWNQRHLKNREPQSSSLVLCLDLGNLHPSYFFFFFLFFLFFFWLHPWHAEMPRPGIEPAPQQWQHQIAWPPGNSQIPVVLTWNGWVPRLKA